MAAQAPKLLRSCTFSAIIKTLLRWSQHTQVSTRKPNFLPHSLVTFRRGLTEGLDPLTLEEAAESLKEQAAVAAASGEEYARLSRSNGGGASSSGEKGGSANGEVQARPQASYTLPDGRTLTLDPHEGLAEAEKVPVIKPVRAQSPDIYRVVWSCPDFGTSLLAEVFLDPSILGFDGPGLAELAMEAATSSFDPVHKRAGEGPFQAAQAISWSRAFSYLHTLMQPSAPSLTYSRACAKGSVACFPAIVAMK
eukprot:1153486-Pelagomonas_calceolata.AAC.4